MSIDMSVWSIHRERPSCSLWKSYGTDSSLSAEKLYCALISAIDILLKKLENFIEMVFKHPFSHLLDMHKL
jgi:hypothetical protein